MIEFLQDYTTEALPPERFTQGQQVERSEASERYFVGRGLAGYVVDEKLVDADHRPIVTQTVTIEIVEPGNRRGDLAVRAGEVMTGQPPRATSGPGVPFVEPEAGVAGSPAVVLEAEVERLKGALSTGDDLFREMNNSHVETNGTLRADVERLTGDLADAKSKGETATNDLQALREQHDALIAKHDEAVVERDRRDERIAELERQLEAKAAPADASGKPSARGK
ncbi:hypothetical protein ACFSGX_13960 [Sphingomonas arantia]|uniref:Uncharacterized protein n=1 Tax=Sphingomonas arantia TaxID=1460676 RepID=A0ABW4U2Q7_9SPHN